MTPSKGEQYILEKSARCLGSEGRQLRGAKHPGQVIQRPFGVRIGRSKFRCTRSGASNTSTNGRTTGSASGRERDGGQRAGHLLLIRGFLQQENTQGREAA